MLDTQLVRCCSYIDRWQTFSLFQVLFTLLSAPMQNWFHYSQWIYRNPGFTYFNKCIRCQYYCWFWRNYKIMIISTEFGLNTCYFLGKLLNLLSFLVCELAITVYLLRIVMRMNLKAHRKLLFILQSTLYHQLLQTVSCCKNLENMFNFFLTSWRIYFWERGVQLLCRGCFQKIV